MKVIFTFGVLGMLIFGNCNNMTDTKLESPSGNNTIEFVLLEDGSPAYRVNHNGRSVIEQSSMGFEFTNQETLQTGFTITGRSKKTVNENWEMPWGEQRTVVNNYNEMVIHLQEIAAPNRQLDIYFRAYDDGVAFRYHFPRQSAMETAYIIDELTEFQLTGDHTTWWIPGDWDIYEHLYTTSKVSEIDAISKRDHPNLAQTYIPHNAVNTPVTMRSAEGLHLSFHEANLTDYSGMTLEVFPDDLKLVSRLVGSENTEHKVERTLPFSTPWRSIQISNTAAGLVESNLIVNLNEPNKLGDVSWFTPMKYVGIWWEMHLGKSTWDFDASSDLSSNNAGELASKTKHGATTENAKRYIDFAFQNNIKGLLVEGWNTGWNNWIGFDDREGVFDFVTPYPDYDLAEVVEYGRERGVELIMHHETSAAPRTYEQQLDTAYTLMQQLGIHSVKTGYVGKIIPKGEYHHGQWMVKHYRKVLETAAKYEVAINAHEPIKDTGIRRTLPNAISREGLRGQEFNAWASDGGNPPEHLPIVTFTRMLSGPIDYTPGIFNIKLNPYKKDNQVNTTLAQQLALYVVIYSPVQMAADLPENYEGEPAFQFIRDVGVDWEQSKVLNGEVGDFVTIAREERQTGNWFVGGITDENARTVTINFDFLDANANYEAIIYRDGEGAHWDDNPTSLEIQKLNIGHGSSLQVDMAEGGGFAISLLKK
jgi:hypothetical protein